MRQPNLAKLRWQCRRGMLELDVILAQLLESTVPHLTEAQQAQFELMLAVDDPTLYAWLMGAEVPLNRDMQEIVSYCIRKNEI